MLDISYIDILLYMYIYIYIYIIILNKRIIVDDTNNDEVMSRETPDLRVYSFKHFFLCKSASRLSGLSTQSRQYVLDKRKKKLEKIKKYISGYYLYIYI